MLEQGADAITEREAALKAGRCPGKAQKSFSRGGGRCPHKRARECPDAHGGYGSLVRHPWWQKSPHRCPTKLTSPAVGWGGKTMFSTPGGGPEKRRFPGGAEAHPKAKARQCHKAKDTPG